MSTISASYVHRDQLKFKKDNLKPVHSKSIGLFDRFPYKLMLFKIPRGGQNGETIMILLNKNSIFFPNLLTFLSHTEDYCSVCSMYI